jgi:hypothetical protein
LTALRPLGQMLPGLASGKQRITIMLDEAIVQAYKARAGGRGYQTLINETLRQGLQADALKEALREVIREELRAAGRNLAPGNAPMSSPRRRRQRCRTAPIRQPYKRGCIPALTPHRLG